MTIIIGKLSKYAVHPTIAFGTIISGLDHVYTISSSSQNNINYYNNYIIIVTISGSSNDSYWDPIQYTDHSRMHGYWTVSNRPFYPKLVVGLGWIM